jgi:hypothetical protein
VLTLPGGIAKTTRRNAISRSSFGLAPSRRILRFSFADGGIKGKP